jgi:hypothetical protein
LSTKSAFCDLDSTKLLGFGWDKKKIPNQHEDNNQLIKRSSNSLGSNLINKIDICDFNNIEVLRLGWGEPKLLYHHENNHKKSFKILTTSYK